ncbi:MAG: ABC transporter ATP-binding protein [Candidatus Krumholzibacteriota bacterium]|nr:ABC transporter ATP-binding protein [Candidatus Krumholzibacteriota bacterium]
MGAGRVLLRFKNIGYGYEKDRPVLVEAGLELAAGERVGLTGPIGSGKTTLLHLAVGLLKPDRGTIEVFGRERRTERDFWEVRERMGLLFQDPEDQLFCPTVLEDLAFGPLNQGRSREETEIIVGETLEILGLQGFEKRITHHLSGGEKRLVSLASILTMKPDALLLDEPVIGLDPESRERIRSLLLTLPQAMIIVSHDREFLLSVTNHTLALRGGRVSPAAERAGGDRLSALPAREGK